MEPIARTWKPRFWHCFQSPRFISWRLASIIALLSVLFWLAPAAYDYGSHLFQVNQEKPHSWPDYIYRLRPADHPQPGRWRSKLRDACHKFAGTIKRINDPDATFFQAGKIIDAFLRKPSFALTQQLLAKHSASTSRLASVTGSCPSLYSASSAPGVKQLSTARAASSVV
jgi:hypothetical protein